MRLTHFFIERPRFATVLSAFVTLLGLGALAILPVAQYPEIVPPTVQITTVYPGASAETVARTVATPKDPASARLNEALYPFVWRSFWGGLGHAWEIEAQRLKRRTQGVWSVHNRMLRFALLIAVYYGVAYTAAGLNGVIVAAGQSAYTTGEPHIHVLLDRGPAVSVPRTVPRASLPAARGSGTDLAGAEHADRASRRSVLLVSWVYLSSSKPSPNGEGARWRRQTPAISSAATPPSSSGWICRAGCSRRRRARSFRWPRSRYAHSRSRFGRGRRGRRARRRPLRICPSHADQRRGTTGETR